MNASVTPLDRGQVQEFDWGRIAWLASGALGNSQTMTFGKVVIKAGRANPRHAHPNCDEILHLLSGRLEHTAADETFPMNPGDTICVPSGVAHNAAAVGDEDAVMVVSFSTPDRQTRRE